MKLVKRRGRRPPVSGFWFDLPLFDVDAFWHWGNLLDLAPFHPLEQRFASLRLVRYGYVVVQAMLPIAGHIADHLSGYAEPESLWHFATI